MFPISSPFKGVAPFILAEVAGLLILFSAIIGNSDAADTYYDASMQKFVASDTLDRDFMQAWFVLFRAYRFQVEGCFQKANTLNLQALNTFLKMKLGNFLPIMYFQTALTAYYLADHTNGYDYAQDSMVPFLKKVPMTNGLPKSVSFSRCDTWKPWQESSGFMKNRKPGINAFSIVKTI